MDKRLSGPNTQIVLLLGAAFVLCFSILVGGFFVHRNTEQLIAAAQWVQHTQEVLLSLGDASRLNDRIDLRTQLYDSTHEQTELDTARALAVRLNTTTIHIKNLVSDNPTETANIAELEACSNEISKELGKSTVSASSIKLQGMRCSRALQFMVDQENGLLKQRSEKSHDRSESSKLLQVSLVALCFLLMVGLFGLSLRDTIARRGFAREAMRVNAELASTVTALEGTARESGLLTAARTELQLCLTVEQVYISAAMRFARLLPGTGGSLLVMNSSKTLVSSVSRWREELFPSPLEELFSPESCCGLRAGTLRWRSPETSELDCHHFQGDVPERYLCVPLVANGETLGVLFVLCPDSESVQTVQTRMESLQQLAQLTAMTLASLQLRTKLENQSIRDPLTGLFNRNFMEIAFERELTRAARNTRPLAVFMLDVDHFKKFNDQYGHAAGDTVLHEVAQALLASVRSEDIVCRYGGEEFILILPDITPEAAFDRAEKIRRRVGNIQIAAQNTPTSVTISVGVALHPQQGRTPEQLMAVADAALYRAKREGRNQVVMA